MKKLFTLFVFALCVSTMVRAQDNNVFQLTKVKGHYLFHTEINQKIPATVFAESGIHVMLVDSLFAFAHQEDFGLKFRPGRKREKMNLGGKVYNITHKAKGKVWLNKHTAYEGEIFVLSGYQSGWEVAVPIQSLHNEKDKGSRIIQLNLRGKQLRMLGKKEWKKQRKGYNKVKINYDTYLDMPAIEGDLNFVVKDEAKTLSGNFVLDLGNPEFLFLFHQSKTVQKFIKKNPGIKVKQVYNKKY